MEQDEEQDLAPQLSGGGCGLGTGTEDEINGAVTFLKWFTEPQNNIAFAVESGYLPVTTGTRCWRASPQARARRQPRQSF